MAINILCAYTDLIDIKKIIPHENNENEHNDEQIKRLAKNMINVGIRHPIIISKRSGKIAAGHCRYLSAKFAGIEKFPVDYQDFKSESEETAFRISDNSIQTDWAEINMDKIKLSINCLEDDFDIELLGFKNININSDIDDKVPDEYGLDKKDDSIAIRLFVDPGMWLGRREEIKNIIDKMSSKYNMKVVIDE